MAEAGEASSGSRAPQELHDVEPLPPSPVARPSVVAAGDSPSGSSRLPRTGLLGVDPDLLMDAARSLPRLASTEPGPEVTEVVADLRRLVRLITEHNQQVMAGEPHDWEALADDLAKAARACRGRVVIELDDVGDAGSG